MTSTTEPHGRLSPYTENPLANPAVIFPNTGMQILSTILNLAGISLISYVFGRRTVFDELLTIRGWMNLSWPRLCVVLVFLTSWMFIFTAGVLISGAGMSLNKLTCEMGVFSCIILYAATKILIYMFLMEKVWIVWAPPSATGVEPRWKSPIYRVCVITMCPYFVIIILMFLGRISELRAHDGVCVIGLQRLSSMSLLCFDLFLTFFLTALFVWPLWASKLISPKLKRVASRTLVASFVALSTSAINIGVLTYMHGRQLGWVCLTSCGSDVTVNAVVLFWVTAGTQSNRSGHHGNQHAPATASLTPGSGLTGGTGARRPSVARDNIEIIDVQTGLSREDRHRKGSKASFDFRRALEKYRSRRESDLGDGGRHDSDDDADIKDLNRSMSEKWRRSLDRSSFDEMKTTGTLPSETTSSTRYPEGGTTQLPAVASHEQPQINRPILFGLHRALSEAPWLNNSKKETSSSGWVGDELSTMEFKSECASSVNQGKQRGLRESPDSGVSSIPQIRTTPPTGPPMPPSFLAEQNSSAERSFSPNRAVRGTTGMGIAMTRIQENPKMEAIHDDKGGSEASKGILRKWRSAMFGPHHHIHEDEEDPPDHREDQLQIATVDEQPRPSYHTDRRPTLPSEQAARNIQRSDHNRQSDSFPNSPTVSFQTNTFGPLPDPTYRFPPLPVTSNNPSVPYQDPPQSYRLQQLGTSYVFGR